MAVHVIVAHWEHFHPDILPSPLLLPRRGTGIIHAPSDRIKPATVMSQCCHGSPAWHKRTMAGASWSSRSIWPSMYGEPQLTRLWQDRPRSLSQWERGEKHDDSIGVLPFSCQHDTMGFRSCLGTQCTKRTVRPIQVFKNCLKSLQTEAMVDSMVAESHLTFGD